MRMSRSQWLGQHVTNNLAAIFGKVFAPKPRKPDRAVPVWQVSLPADCGYAGALYWEVSGWTKGEARCALKQKLFMKRLPVGTSLVRKGLATAAR